MRVLFLPKYSAEGASSRYRVHQFIDYYRTRGIECHVSSFYTDRQVQLGYQNDRVALKVALLVISFARRIAAALQAGRYDLVYLHRECTPAGPLLLERLFRLFGIKVIFDYDDALFLFRANRNVGLWNLFKNPDRLALAISYADCVVAGNRYLADYAARHCPRTEVVPGAEDMRHLKTRIHTGSRDFVTIGWIGSPSTERYLNVLADPLRRLKQAVPRLKFVVVGGRSFSIEGIDVVHIPWQRHTEADNVASLDIGVMPLPEDDWSLGKCGGKARLYMGSAVPPVVTGIGYNQELIRHGETGMLVRSQEEWFSALRLLCANPSLRARMGKAAQDHVREHLSLESVGDGLIAIMRDVAQKAVSARPHRGS